MRRTIALGAWLALAVHGCGAAPPESASPKTPATTPPTESTAPTPAARPAPARAAETPDAPAVTSEEPEDVATPPPPAEPPPIPDGTTVLHIGDSFAGALGLDLNKELKARGVRSILKYQTASYIPTWASSKDLDKYLWQYKPDLVLITLGANELEVPDPEIRAETIQRLVKRLGGRPCVWIAPPLWEGARDVLLPVIERNAAPCVYMSNADIAKDMPRARDKIHPSMNARRAWAKHVVGWLLRHRVPDAERPWEIRAEKPGDAPRVER